MSELKPIEIGDPERGLPVLTQGSEGVVVGNILDGEAAPRDFNPDIVKRSVVVAGHKTSVSLEDAFWHALKDIARERQMSLRSLIAEIDSNRRGGNLSSAVRLHVLDHYRRRCGALDATAQR
ncbi:ribbon-helix-helix domain-containing protein [Chelatococcus sambhunathii]|uniref:Ribbon-helix-helix domain-containing protein n=1 Tax=Chelatococcus sambhunathii TaxID=363953 RepID=A0ABU1DBS7_9HYPH|nr:ribbon-helix-helix domain-containing protein [Chelatococcus sambhunathii]